MKYETPEMTTLTPAIKAIQGPGSSGMKDETQQLLDSSTDKNEIVGNYMDWE